MRLRPRAVDRSGAGRTDAYAVESVVGGGSMMPTSRPRRWLLPVGVAALGCATCCAGPIIGLLGGIAAASAVGAVLVPALVVLAVLAVAVAGIILLRRRRSASAAVGNGARRTEELGLPAVDGVRDSTTRVRR
jgi:hypothetical protein